MILYLIGKITDSRTSTIKITLKNGKKIELPTTLDSISINDLDVRRVLLVRKFDGVLTLYSIFPINSVIMIQDTSIMGGVEQICLNGIVSDGIVLMNARIHKYLHTDSDGNTFIEYIVPDFPKPQKFWTTSDVSRSVFEEAYYLFFGFLNNGKITIAEAYPGMSEHTLI